MVISTHVHPDVRSLRDFILGKLSDSDRTAEIEAHIESCKECCTLLEQIGADTFEDLACGRPTELLMSVHHQQYATINSTEALLKSLDSHQRYEMLGVLGHGGMATVFRAQHRLMGRIIAMKVISPAFDQCQETLKRFHREVRATGKLKHPNIVTVFDAELIDEKLILAMELVSGKTLSQVVESSGTLGISSALTCVLQVARALAYSHKQGIIHRDIKPSNVMLTEDGQVKLLDFGLAHLPVALADESNNLDSSTSVMGTPNYMSPEQYLAPETVDHRTDIYSLGCTLFYLIFGKSPHSRNPWAQILRKNEGKQLVLPSQEKCPLQLQIILKRMLARDPDERFNSMEEVVSAIMNFCRRQKYQISESIVIADRKPAPRFAIQRIASFVTIGGFSLVGLSIGTIVLYGWMRPWNMFDLTRPSEAKLNSLVISEDNAQDAKLEVRDQQSHSSLATKSTNVTGVLQNVRTIDLGAPVTSLALSPNQNTLVIGTGGADGVIRLWDLGKMQELPAIRAHREAVWALAISDKKNLLASGGQDLRQRSDHGIRITDLSTSQVMTTLSAHTDTVSSLTFIANDSRLLSTSWDRSLCVWDIDQFKKIVSWTFELPILACVVSSDNRIAAFTLEDGRIKVFDINKGAELGTLNGHSGRVECLKFLTDESMLVSAGHDQTIRIWSLDQFELIQSFPAHERAIRTMQLASDGAYVLTGAFDQSIRAWRLSDGKEIAKGLGHMNEVTAMVLSVDQKQVISGAMDMTFRVWTIEDAFRSEQSKVVTE